MRNPEEQEMNRKRKNSEEDENEFLTLSLSYGPPIRPRRSPSLEIQPTLPQPPTIPSPISFHPQNLPPFSTPIPTQSWAIQALFSSARSLYVQQPFPEPRMSMNQFVYQEPVPIPVPSPSPISRPVRSRRNPSQGPREGKSDTVPVPFPWATNYRAKVQSLVELREKRIFTITGKVECKTCEESYEMGVDLEEKFDQVSNFIITHRCSMHDRAPSVWVNPIMPTCKKCGNSVKPIISEKKKSINWLFLLLGQMLGCCTLEQLKYFCKHTKNHRTGAKDRVLYLAYLGLCKQLDPEGPFDLKWGGVK